MQNLGIRFDPQEVQEIKAAAAQHHESLSDLVRRYVRTGLLADSQPAPQPAPQPVPQPGKLPELLVERIGVLRRDRDELKEWLLEERLKLWLPKLVAVASCAVAIFCHNGYLAYACCWIWLATVVLDALWVGRDNRCAVMGRAVQQLWDLLSSVPDRYAQQCLQLPPQLAVLAVLEFVNQRRRRVGELGMKELGMKFWNPDGYQAAQY